MRNEPACPPCARRSSTQADRGLSRLTATLLAVVAAAAALTLIAIRDAAAQNASGSGVVVIANGWSPPDVGAAAPLAGRLDAAVLYASKDELGQSTMDALEELDPDRVLLMGGTAALTPAVEQQVRRLLPGAGVERFSGDDRIDTAAKAALSDPPVPAGQPVVIAHGWSPSDVGTAAPVAAQLGGSVLYADRGSLGAPTVAALRRLLPSRVVIVGGLGAVSADIESQIGSVASGAVIERLSGTDRVDTAALGIDLAGVALGGPVVLANGWSAPDVGIAAPLAATLGGSVLLTERSELGERTAEALEDLSPSHIILIGGSDRFAEAVEADLERLHPSIPRVNLAGADRIATAAIAALFGFEFAAEQQRFEQAVATITPGEADCDAAPQLDVAGIEVVAPPDDLNDHTTPLTVAEVVRIAGGCALVDYVALDGRTAADIRDLLADYPDVFAVDEPLRGFTSLHDDGAHRGYGPRSGTHYNDGDREVTEQWHLPADYMEDLWKGWDDANPVVVAVIDGSFDVDHPDLQNRIVNGGLDECHRQHDDPLEDTHGTHVAGIVAAERGNGGVSGVAPGAQLLPIRYQGCDIGPVKAVALALANENVKAINMSFGIKFTEVRTETCASSDTETSRGTDDWRVNSSRDREYRGRRFRLPADCDTFGQMLKIADELGIVSIAAAGNSGHCEGVYEQWVEDRVTDLSAAISDTKWCKALDPNTGLETETPHTFYLPAGFTTTIAVTSIDRQGLRDDSSNQNSYNTIAAPGNEITSVFPVVSAVGAERAFGTISGTSMASPFVAGVVALMLNRHPDAEPWQVRRALSDTARYPRGLTPEQAENKKLQYGHGIVEPREAILRLGELMDPNRTPNRIDGLQVTGRSCEFGDDTPNCADPTPVSLQPKFAPAAYPSLRKYTIEVPRDIDHISVNIEYDSNGRPGKILWNSRDNDPQTAGHQIRFATTSDSKKLTLWLPTWKGDAIRNPYELTFMRTGPDEPASRGGRSVAVGGGKGGSGNDGGHSCTITRDGTIDCWGSNLYGQLEPDTDDRFSSVDLGFWYSCGIRVDMTIACWGRNDHGQLETPSGRFSDFSVGGWHACGLKVVGSIACWGRYGESDAPHGKFVKVAVGDGTYEVYNDQNYSCAIRTNGTLVCWGRAAHNRLKPPAGIFTDIALSRYFACGIRRNGEIACWGRYSDGILRPPPGEFTTIGVGFQHACGLRTNGLVECWGKNRYGELRAAPSGNLEPPDERFSEIEVGDDYTCGITRGRMVRCWGADNFGEGSSPPGTFTQIATAIDHACGITTDGAIACWGHDTFGQSRPPSDF